MHLILITVDPLVKSLRSTFEMQTKTNVRIANSSLMIHGDDSKSILMFIPTAHTTPCLISY